jgi:hypothetical protein
METTAAAACDEVKRFMITDEARRPQAYIYMHKEKAKLE